MAVDLLYQVNYVGPPYQKEDVDLVKVIVRGLQPDKINHPDCLMVDPKLLHYFFRCYDNNDTDGYNQISTPEPFKEDHGQLLGFETENRDEAFLALWFWQCQYLVMDELQCSWAKQIEIIYNWICFLSMAPRGILSAAATIADDATVNEFKRHIVRGLGLPAPKVDLKTWWQILCGYNCAVAGGAFEFRKFFEPRPELAELGSLLTHYQLGQPPPSGIGQLTPEDVHELDAAFIKSGPLKFCITSDIKDHLEFDSSDTDCISIYFDRQVNPGARGIIYKNNLIAGSITQPFSGADCLDSTSCLSCMRRSTALTVSCLVKMDAE
jgi:hypothetical protein